MTNEEAIKFLKYMANKTQLAEEFYEFEALNIAIKALEEPSDCVLNQFGECSYKETGCSDCLVKAEIRIALGCDVIS